MFIVYAMMIVPNLPPACIMYKERSFLPFTLFYVLLIYGLKGFFAL